MTGSELFAGVIALLIALLGVLSVCYTLQEMYKERQETLRVKYMTSGSAEYKAMVNKFLARDKNATYQVLPEFVGKATDDE